MINDNVTTININLGFQVVSEYLHKVIKTTLDQILFVIHPVHIKLYM